MSEAPRMKDRNIILTGTGRSGTTLTCYLLNKLPNTVALSGSIAPGEYADRLPDRRAVADGIEEFYQGMRRRALEQGMVFSKHVGGQVPDNTKGTKDGVRQRIAKKGWIEVGKDLDPDFYLAIKQRELFTTLLPVLAQRFSCFAIVRNPLAMMASIKSLQAGKRSNKPSAKGNNASAGGNNASAEGNNAPAEGRFGRYDPDLHTRLQESKRAGTSGIEQRLLKLHLTYERYQQLLPESHVLRYEDICESRGKALEVIVPAARELDEPLENKNLSPLYERDKVLRFGEALLASEGAYWNLYTRESVEEIMSGLS
jgi:hypothetical protein